MFVETPATPYLDNSTSIAADDLNARKRDLARAPDFTGGSEGVAYTPATVVKLQGEGLELGGVTAPRLKYTSRSITRTQGATLLNLDTGVWSPGNIVIGVPAEQGIQDLRFPNGCTLNTVTAYHNRTDTGLSPGTRVTLQIFKQNIVTGVATQIGATTSDPAASLVAYEAHHGFSITGLSEVIDRTVNTYYAILNGESGSNQTTTTWYGCTTTVTITDQDEFQ